MDDSATLRTSADVVRLTFPGETGPIHVLQLGDADQNLVVTDGGPLIFALLELCEGGLSYGELLANLRVKFDGPESLWASQLPTAVDALLGWRVLERV